MSASTYNLPGRTTHGARMTRLTIGVLPQEMKQQCTAARKYRKDLEAEVADVKGEIDLTDAHLIDEATGAEVHAAICRWLLRDRLATMSTSDIAKCSEQIMKCRQTRNRAFERLGLREHGQKVIDAMYDIEPSEPPDGPPQPARDADMADGTANNPTDGEAATDANGDQTDD